VQVGDWVLTRNQNDPSAPLERHQVTAVSVHTVDRLRLLEIQEADGSTETIRTTDEHPFWVKDVGWVKAGDLQVGQQLLTTDGRLATLTATQSEAHPEGISVYNLTVADDHTYFVTAVADDEAVWVHNTDPTTQPVGDPNAGHHAPPVATPVISIPTTGNPYTDQSILTGQDIANMANGTPEKSSERDLAMAAASDAAQAERTMAVMRQQVGGYDATVLVLSNLIPIVRIPTTLMELKDGTVLVGEDFGQPLGGMGYAGNVITIGVDVFAAAVMAKAGIQGVNAPKPPVGSKRHAGSSPRSPIGQRTTSRTGPERWWQSFDWSRNWKTTIGRRKTGPTVWRKGCRLG
jgi:hypothetical protein